MIELQGECGTCCSGRSTDYLVVSKSHRHCIRKVRAGHKCSVVGARGDCVRCVAEATKDSDLAAGLSFAADFAGGSHSRVEWLKRFRAQRMPFPATRRKKRPSQVCWGQRWATPSSYPSRFPSGRWLLSGTSSPKDNWRDPRGAGGVVATRGQPPIYRLKPIRLKRVDV